MLYRLSYGLLGEPRTLGPASGPVNSAADPRRARRRINADGNHRTFAMGLEFRADAETAESLRARAERCRALSRVAVLPFAYYMLEGLAQQLDGEARRAEAEAPLERAR